MLSEKSLNPTADMTQGLFDEEHVTRVPRTEQTILSPFTEEYRALGTSTGILNFLACPYRGPPKENKDGQNLANPHYSDVAVEADLIWA